MTGACPDEIGSSLPPKTALAQWRLIANTFDIVEPTKCGLNGCEFPSLGLQACFATKEMSAAHVLKLTDKEKEKKQHRWLQHWSGSSSCLGESFIPGGSSTSAKVTHTRVQSQSKLCKDDQQDKGCSIEKARELKFSKDTTHNVKQVLQFEAVCSTEVLLWCLGGVSREG